MSTPTVHFRRIGLATLATTMVLGGSVVAAGSASAEADFDFSRVAGANRYETAAKAAKEFGPANTVILASGEPGRYPDALTANYIAGLKNAPVLLTRQSETPAEVKKAISDSGAKNVILVGGPGAISEEQEKSLQGTYTVKRLAGADRFATAAKVIAEGDEAQGDTALLATGMDFPDALGGGPVAFAEKMPLAITRPEDAPDNVVSELKQAGINKVLVLGGKSAVSDAVVEELKNKGITVTERFAGKDRAETSGLLAEYAVKNYGFKDTAVNVASGYVKGDGADALGGAALTGKQDRTLLISKTDKDAGEGVLTFLKAHAQTLTEGIIFGGEGALTTAAENQMVQAVLGSGAQNARTGEYYNDVQAAIDEAEKGDTITVFGAENSGFRVTKSDLTIAAQDGAAVTSPIVIQNADDVTIDGFTIKPGDVGGQVAGVYLNNAEGIVLSGNTVQGADGTSGAGVINEIGGEDEVAEIKGNTFRALRQGVYANPTAEFLIDSNEFRGNMAGSANDVASTITNNKFINNDEGIGLGAKGSKVEGNYFANNQPHVKDWTNDPAAYDLEAMIKVNEFDEAVKVSEDGTAIEDES